MSVVNPAAADPRLKLVKVAAAGILVLGGASGLLLNGSSADSRVRQLREDPTLLASSVGLAVPVSEPPGPAVGDRRVLVSLRSVQVDVPADPFQPTAMDRPINRLPLLAEPEEMAVRGPRMETATPRPEAAKPAPAAPAVAAEELALTGVVQGDPPVAVVQFQGQSLFLKIGDQVADSWRLVEVRERSAIFQMGARRVEVPIKGGSSE